MSDRTSDHAPAESRTDQEAWDARYREGERLWSGEPNTALVERVEGLAPGRALDLGCGEGADAVWLARQGWRVTAVDVSGVALERGARHAAQAGVAERVEWLRADLSESFPGGSFDLVSAQFLYFPGRPCREEVLRAAAAAVAPGGVLLIEGHSGFPDWEDHGHHDMDFPTPRELLDSLRLPDGAWEVLVCEEHERSQTAPDGRATIRTDQTLELRRRAA